jgi:hypothetical protein
MKSTLSLCGGIVLMAAVSIGLLAQQNRVEGSGTSAKTAGGDTSKGDKPSPISTGEKLNYVASWSNFLTAGRLTLSVQESPDKKSILLHADAETVGLVKAIYALSNHYDSTLEKSTLLPNLFSIRSKDLSKPTAADKLSEVRFDQAKHVAKTGEESISIAPQTYDLISILYAIRMLDLKQGKKYPLAGFDGKNKFSLEAESLGAESVDVGGEPNKAIKVSVRYGKDGETPDDENEIRIWFSADPKHTPLLITANPPFGLIKVELRTAAANTNETKRAMPREDPIKP